MKRTHRAMLVLNYAVSFQDHDDTIYMEYAQLKKYLSRRELMKLYSNIKAGKNYIGGLDNPVVSQVIGV